MAKSCYIPKLLFIAALLVYCYAGCVDVRRKYQVLGIKYQVLGIKYQVEARDKKQGTKTGAYKVKMIYDSQLGVKETDDNAGPRIDEYLRYVNLKKGQPWCAAFTCWVYGQAGVTNPRSGWSPDLFKGTKVIWKRNSPLTARKGSAAGERQPGMADVFGIWFPEKGRIAHAGFIDEWDKTWLITVEGNTNRTGSREGDGVFRKRRLVRSIYQVARYVPSRAPP